jgi:hypothetical protein
MTLCVFPIYMPEDGTGYTPVHTGSCSDVAVTVSERCTFAHGYSHWPRPCPIWRRRSRNHCAVSQRMEAAHFVGGPGSPALCRNARRQADIGVKIGPCEVCGQGVCGHDRPEGITP